MPAPYPLGKSLVEVTRNAIDAVCILGCIDYQIHVLGGGHLADSSANGARYATGLVSATDTVVGLIDANANVQAQPLANFLTVYAKIDFASDYVLGIALAGVELNSVCDGLARWECRGLHGTCPSVSFRWPNWP